MSSGSSARLIVRIRSTASSPCSATSASSLCMPMPCSPVQVPPIAIARSADALRELLGLRALGGVVGIEQHEQVEVAVADVTDDRRDEPRRLDVGARLEHAVGEARDRHAGIGGERLLARAQRQRRVVRVVPRLPELRAILRLRRPLERAAAVLGGDRLHQLRLLAHAVARCRGTRRTASASPRSLRASSSAMHASICTSSSSSMRATGMPVCIARITVLHRRARGRGTGRPPRRSPRARRTAAAGSR